MNDPFLKKVGVSNPTEAMRNSLNAALKRNKTYKDGVSNSQREAFRRQWASLIKKAAEDYVQPVTDDHHCDTISKIAHALSQQFNAILANQRLRFGTSQKALNLYLKFLWRLGQLPVPPHCPIDGIVLRAAKICGSWTKSDCAAEYTRWIGKLRVLTERTTLAEWEYDQWNRNAQ